MENILKMLRITNAPTVPAGEDEIAQDVDEPPDDKVPEMNSTFKKENVSGRHVSTPILPRRESLLTKAIQAGHESQHVSPRFPQVARGMSTTSSHSFASTAELTSDLDSPIRSASPSPPPPPFNRVQFAPVKDIVTDNIAIADATVDVKPLAVESGEAALEKAIGRKRCIMFACNDTLPEPSPTTIPTVKLDLKPKEITKADPAPRKCKISFACPSRPSTESKENLTKKELPRRQSSPAPTARNTSQSNSMLRRATEATLEVVARRVQDISYPRKPSPVSPTHPFHEFASSHDETDAWVEKDNTVSKPKLTLDDCYQKELAIRKIGREAEEEAEAEEREQDAADNQIDEDDDVEDDFAPSDDARSDDGNESDDEEGFAESDSESDDGSEYRFWAPSTTTAATSTDNLTHFSSRQSRSRGSSTSSAVSYVPALPHGRRSSKVKIPKALKMRPGTPELPDSTDFVCGTFDEDRPLEAAYVSCREQKRREKLVTIPQDIDPSFPTTDPEDEGDNDDDVLAESSDQLWIKDQLEGFDESDQGRRPSAFLISPLHSPAPNIAPPRPGRPSLLQRRTPRSPAPQLRTARSPAPQLRVARSPAPRRLFDHAHRRPRSPAPAVRLHSPRGSPTNARPAPFGITINRLAQRPNAEKTSSLPHTPNPFFRNWQAGTQPVSRITSAAETPGIEEMPADMHVRGPVDIVIGLEKKRQKRKEKFWRQHCRQAAKEKLERKPAHGQGAKRMRELGLECAERTRGYNLGRPAHHVLSL